ncbi:hypothetical protein C8J56DRAFT_1157947 [Mycena floridula]|nr:hypothetical protein C8J56DRAFT_1157947 [Mycena floridula]
MIIVGQERQVGASAHSNARFPRSGVVVLGSNSILSLVPSTLVSQAEALLEAHRIQDAVDLADQQHNKIYGNLTVDQDQADELRYVYQRIGCQCFTETLFEDAGTNFFKGELDPRLLISYYPELRGGLFASEEALDVFAGVAEQMPSELSVDDIIVTNIVRNYSPHLAPDTKSAPPTAELRKILGVTAQEMLEAFLRRCRTRALIDSHGAPQSKSLHAAVDTVLAKLFAQFEKTKDLYTLIQESNDIVLSELEPVLKKTGQYYALSLLYKQHGEDSKLLEIWSKIIDGEWTDEDIKDPITNMVSLLTEKKDRALTQTWAIWLTNRAPETALKLLTTRDTGKRREKAEDDEALLAQIEETNSAAAIHFLEHLILQKRTLSKDLHMRYAKSCVEQVLLYLKDDSVSKLWRAKASSYASGRTGSSVSFISYFSSTTPDSESKRHRLKTALFLQVSQLYDVSVIRDMLLPFQKALTFEMAIVDGKLSNHRAALTSLVHDLHDSTSAEAYCALGGDLIPTKIALSIIENSGLQLHQNLWTTTQTDGKRKIITPTVKVVNEELKQDLLKILLEVYMNDSDLGTDRASHLLNSQGKNLDILDVISLVPADWSLNLLSSFLTRSFRRTLHQRHEGQILKTISAGQNLEVKEEAWLILRDEGMVVEEPADDEGTDEEETENEKFDEKDGAALVDGVDIHVEKRQSWHTDNVLDVR